MTRCFKFVRPHHVPFEPRK